VQLIRDWFFQHTSEDLLIATTQHANEACRRLLQRAGAHRPNTTLSAVVRPVRMFSVAVSPIVCKAGRERRKPPARLRKSSMLSVRCQSSARMVRSLR
jgi:hypothetical protein